MTVGSLEQPEWLEVIEGRTPVVIVAPHGGRRDRPIRRGDGINDLHTAELARELARLTGAHALINHALDRNDADLNRISDLSTKAPEVLAAWHELIDAAAAEGAVPLVLLVHGWNMALPCCDVGVGLRRRRDRLTGRYPTLSRARFDGFVGRLQSRLDDVGIDMGIGQRYAASGKDNATQLFSGRHHDHDHPLVAALSARARRGEVDAVQLELGIPLRWPGKLRAGFVAATVKAVQEDLGRRDAVGEAAVRPRSGDWALPSSKPAGQAAAGEGPEPGYSIQAALADGSGLFVGVEATGPETMAARLCVASADGSMSLFVGEGPWGGEVGSYRIGGLTFTAETDDEPAQRVVAKVSFDGLLVRYPTHEAFVDLEAGLAGASVDHASVSLAYEGEPRGFGRILGRIVLDGSEVRVDARAVADRGSRGAPGKVPRGRVFVTDGADAPCVVELEGDDRVASFATGDDGEISEVELVSKADVGSTRAGTLTARVPVYRVLPGGAVLRVTFGVARFEDPAATDPAASSGTFELLEVVSRGG